MRRTAQIALIVTAFCIAVAPLPRGLVERFYSRGMYPVIQPVLTSFSNRVPFALLDLTLGVVLALTVAIWIVRLRGPRRGATLNTLGHLALSTATIGALLYLWFLAAWGMNYQREPLRAQLDFEQDRISDAAARALAVQNVEALNRLDEPAHRAGWVALDESRGALSAAFDRAQRDLAMRWQAVAGRPKRSLLDFYFKRVAVDGMTDPFFLETLANQSLLPFERPFVVAHEWSHLAGYADESEANFVAWLICLRGSDSDRYSAWISLYGTVISALPPAARPEIVGRLGAGPTRDLQAMADRVQREVNPAANRAGYAVYDRFLKANRIEAGVRSYSEVIRLLLGTRFEADGSPVLRNRTGS